MVIKGSARGASAPDVRSLAAHLLHGENETVAVLQISGTTATELGAALMEMRAVSLGGRTRRALYHASLNVAPEEVAAMSLARWRESVDELERQLGLSGHPRAVIRHRKRDRDHVHVVWARVDGRTLKCVSDANNYLTHEQTARVLETRFGLRPVVGVHTRAAGTPRPVAMATHRCWQAAERTKRPVADVAARMRAAWDQSRNGKQFAAALQAWGLSLAAGRRGLLVIDEDGTPHALARRLGLRAAEVRRKLADLNEADFPSVEDARRAPKKRRTKTMTAMGVRNASVEEHFPGEDEWKRIEQYWQDLGYNPLRRWDAVLVIADGAFIIDTGGRIEIESEGPPTDKQVAVLVAACVARNWGGIHFFGAEEFQRRAKAEAIRQGYPADQITLECEQLSGGGRPAEEAMPLHLRRRLGHELSEPPPIKENAHDAEPTPSTP